MPSDVNPFEPWRPRGASGDDDVVHPWRVPLPGDRDEDDEDREIPHYERRAGRTEREEPADPPRPPSFANGLLVLLFLGLLIGGLGSLGASGGGHMWRIGTVCAALFLGPLIGLSVLHRSPWKTRLGVCAAAGLLALACLYFVPTAGGLNLWTATARLAALGRIEPGDHDAFLAARPGIAEVRQEFRSLAPDIARAEQAWETWTTNEVVQRVAAQRAADPDGAMETLEKFQNDMQRLGRQPAVHAAFKRTVAETIEAMVQRLDRDSSDLANQGQFLRAQELLAERGKAIAQKDAPGNRADIAGRVKGMQRAVLARHVEEGRKLLTRLAKEGKWDEAVREGRRLNADVLDAAGLFGEAKRARGAFDGPRREAIAGKLDAAAAAAARKVEAGEFDDAERIARDAVAAVSDDARAVGVTDVAARFVPLRRQALLARIGAAARALQGRLDKKDYAGVAASGAEARGKLIDAARELGQERALDDAIGPVRRKAFAARLDLAREEFTALLVKERYAEIGKAADRADAALGPEADALGRRGDLDGFVGGLRFHADLAALAGKK